jgi:hypothetical protein
MIDLNLTQLGGVVLIVIGAVWWISPRAWSWIQSWRSVEPPVTSDGPEALSDRMARLAALQSDLEARGHTAEAATAGGWYSMLRDPVLQNEAPAP